MTEKNCSTCIHYKICKHLLEYYNTCEVVSQRDARLPPNIELKVVIKCEHFIHSPSSRVPLELD